MRAVLVAETLEVSRPQFGLRRNRMVQDLAIAAALLLSLLVATELGFRGGRRKARSGQSVDGGSLGSIQGAVLGLLALLLGFSFAGAATRFLERQDLIVQEANAIGTAYLRAELLNASPAAQLRSSLARYVEHRVRISETLRNGLSPQDAAEIQRLHDQIWQAARQGALDRPEAAMLVIPPVNDVIDLHATRLAAARKHLPFTILAVLASCSALAIGVIGYGCGLSGRRYGLMTGALAFLIASALWITLDLDHPRAGLIRLNDAPLRELKLAAPG